MTSYSPINPLVYYAAHAGAISGMAIPGWIIDPTKQDYSQVVGIAGAFAQAFDQAWDNTAIPSVYEAEAITAVVSSDFQQRGPGPLAFAQYSNPANWTIAAAACVALILESDAYLASQGLNPPPGNGGSGLIETAYAQSTNIILPFGATNPTQVVSATVTVPTNCKIIAHFDGVFLGPNEEGNYTVGFSIGRGTSYDTIVRLVNLVPFGSNPGAYVPYSYTYEYALDQEAVGPAVTISGLAILLNESPGLTLNATAYSNSLQLEVVSV